MGLNYDYQVYKLSAKFYQDYPHKQFPEILEKPTRGYNCILIDCHTDYFVCVPFRSEINHSNGFHFHNTNRSKHHRSGLDYSKMVIIKDTDYLDNNAVIDKDEYLAMVNNIDKIVQEALAYLTTYINHKNKTTTLHPKRYQRDYSKSSLPYFDSILFTTNPNSEYQLHDQQSKVANTNPNSEYQTNYKQLI